MNTSSTNKFFISRTPASGGPVLADEEFNREKFRALPRVSSANFAGLASMPVRLGRVMCANVNQPLTIRDTLPRFG